MNDKKEQQKPIIFHSAKKDNIYMPDQWIFRLEFKDSMNNMHTSICFGPQWEIAQLFGRGN